MSASCDESRPPGAEIAVSTVAMGGALGAALVVAVVAVLATHRRVLRSAPAEVLRHAG